MAVLYARERWESRGGDFGDVKSNRLRRQFLVKTDNRYDTPLTVATYLDATLDIRYLKPHPDRVNYTLRTINCDQLSETPFAWDVVLTYSTEPIEDDREQQQIEDPLARPIRLRLSGELAQVFTTKDKDDKPMLNSAGDCFEPWEKDDPRLMISVSRNVQDVPTWVFEYLNKVNQNAITLYGQSLAARTCKLQSVEIGELQKENDITFYEVSAQIAYKPDKWDAKRLDEGFHENDGITRSKIILDDGEEPTEPVPLDGTGDVLADPTPDTAVYLTFYVYEEADFTPLVGA